MPAYSVSDKATKERNDLFFKALGQFFYNYTNLEHQLTCLVRNVATTGITSTHYLVVSATFGGMRMAMLKETVKRLLRVSQAPKSHTAMAERLFKHLGDIEFFRNRLAHHFTEPLTDQPDHQWRNSDYASVREGEAKEYVFDTGAVIYASADLKEIALRADGIFSHYQTDIGVPAFNATPPTWRYKREMLALHRPKSSDSQQPPPPPLAASKE